MATPGAQGIGGARARTGLRRATARHPALSLQTVTGMCLVSGTGGTLVRAELRYRCDDPFAVRMVLSAGVGQVVGWTVGRDLLMAGVRQPSVWVTFTSTPQVAMSSSSWPSVRTPRR